LAQTTASVCAGDNVTLSVTNAGTSTVNWYDAATNGNLLFTGASFTTAPVSSVSYYAEITNGNCVSPSRTKATVTVSPRPSQPGLQASNVQVCAGSTATLRILTPQAGVTYNWYAAATGGNPVFTGTTFVTPAITQNTTYYAEAANTATSCTNNGGRVAASITINSLAAAPTLSATTIQVCNGGSVTISVTNPLAGQQYNWYTAATGGTPIFTGASFTASNLTANVSYFVEAATASGCVSATRTETTITVLPVPAAPTVLTPAGGITACAGSSATISIDNAQADLVYRWYGTATGGTPLFTGTSFTTPAITAATTYYVDATSAGNCNPSTRTPVTVTPGALPNDPVVAAANVAVCSGNSATLSVSSPQAGVTYNWYNNAAETNLLFTGAKFTTAPITATTNFYVSAINASGCSSASLAQVQVTIQPPPSAPVIANGSTVQSCTGSTVTLNISNPQAGFTYNWYTAATGGTPTFTGTSFTTTALTANTTFYAEAVNSTGCTSTSRTSVDIIINALPTAPKITDQAGSSTPAVCPGSKATLTASSATPNVTFNWYTVATGGTPVFTGASFTTPVITAATTYYAEAVSAAGGCASSTRTSVTVTPGNSSAPQPKVIASGLSICSGNSTTIAIANPDAGTTYNFYTAATGGSPLFTGTGFNTPVITANTTYYVEAVNAQYCSPSSRLAVTVNITTSPAAPVPTAANVNVCSGSTATLSIASPQAGITYKWYDSASKTNLLFTGVTYTTAPLTANTTFYIDAVSASGCSSAGVAQVQVTIQAAPAAPVLNRTAATVCEGTQLLVSVTNPQAGLTYNWYNVATGGSSFFTGIDFPTPGFTSSVTYYAEAVNSTGCPSATRTPVVFTVTPLPTPPKISDKGTTVCTGATTTLTATSDAGTTISWYADATGGTALATGATFTTPAITATITYYAEAVSGTGGCASVARTPVTLTPGNNPAPQPQVNNSGLSVCANSPAVIAIANPDANTIYNFYTAATGGSPLFTGTSFSTPVLTASTTYYVEAVSTQYCAPSDRLAVNVSVAPQPTTPTPSAAVITICTGSAASLSVASPQAGITYNWYDSASKTNLLHAGTTYTTGALTANTVFYIEATNGSCTSPSLASVQVNVTDMPNAPVLVNNAITTCEGGQVVVSIANPQSGFTYNWYATATGGTSLFTGTDFVTPTLTGNVTYYAEAENSTGCPSATRAAAVITVMPSPAPPQVSAQGTMICPGTTATLTASSDAGTTISWYAGATGGTALATGNSFTTPVLSANTTYYAGAANTASVCSSPVRTAVTVTILQPLAAPNVTVSASTASSVTFVWGAVAGAIGYQVSLDNGATFIAPSSGNSGLTEVVDNLQADQTITILVRSVGGTDCQLSANAPATGKTTNPLGDGIFVPNAFTPNGDGNNDILYVYGNEIKGLTFSVYDQWGELQFKSENKSAGWDGTFKGKGQPVGVYVYFLEATLNDGHVVKKKGTITLLR
jgi:gliding motility-associated-like protein